MRRIKVLLRNPSLSLCSAIYLRYMSANIYRTTTRFPGAWKNVRLSPLSGLTDWLILARRTFPHAPPVSHTIHSPDCRRKRPTCSKKELCDDMRWLSNTFEGSCTLRAGQTMRPPQLRDVLKGEEAKQKYEKKQWLWTVDDSRKCQYLLVFGHKL